MRELVRKDRWTTDQELPETEDNPFTFEDDYWSIAELSDEGTNVN